MTTPVDFRRLARQGVVVRGGGFEVHLAAPPGPPGVRPARLGIVIQRSVLPKAVERNHWKRWIREAFRRNVQALVPGTDRVVILRNPLARRYTEVEATLLDLWRQAQTMR